MPLRKINQAVQQVNRTVNSTNQIARNTKQLGRELGQNDSRRKAPVQPRSATPTPQAQPQGWACTCGTINQGKFCGECGTKRAVCPNCNQPLSSKFCPDCGAAAE